MLGFYYGTSIPNQDAQEGIYFIKDENNKSYSIYIKIKDENAVKYGDTSDNKSDKDHYHKFTPKGEITQPSFIGDEATISADYTPEGTVSEPIFTGATTTISTNYTPEGTVSQPSFTGKEITSGEASANTTSVLTSVLTEGTLPSLSYTKPTCTHTAAIFSPSVDENGVLSYEFSGGEIKFNAGSIDFKEGKMPTFNTGTATTPSHNHKVIPEGTISQPSFTGTTATISTNYTPEGTVSQPTFSGTTAAISANYTPEGSINELTFEGKEATISANYTPEGTVSQPSFTGTETGTKESEK